MHNKIHECGYEGHQFHNTKGKPVNECWFCCEPAPTELMEGRIEDAQAQAKALKDKAAQDKQDEEDRRAGAALRLAKTYDGPTQRVTIEVWYYLDGKKPKVGVDLYHPDHIREGSVALIEADIPVYFPPVTVIGKVK